MRSLSKELPAGLSLPLVIKPRMEGSSIGLSMARDRQEFYRACKEAFRYGKTIIAEEFIEGREITVGILGKKSLPVLEVRPAEKFYNYKAKYEDPRTRYVVPAKMSVEAYKSAQRLALKAHNALGCSDFSRVDMLLSGEGSIFVLEVNSIPGLTERSLLPKAAKAVGIDFDRLCSKLIELAVKNRNKKV